VGWLLAERVGYDKLQLRKVLKGRGLGTLWVAATPANAETTSGFSTCAPSSGSLVCAEGGGGFNPRANPSREFFKSPTRREPRRNSRPTELSSRPFRATRNVAFQTPESIPSPVILVCRILFAKLAGEQYTPCVTRLRRSL
jgi:hypothetical protein